MTEKEKMLTGALYDPGDPELTALRQRAQALCRKICLDDSGDPETRCALLKELFGATGAWAYVEPNFRCDYGFNIRAGENFYANYDCIMLDSAPITIGAECMFGPRVSLITATHPVEALVRSPGEGQVGEYAQPITIGDRVWLGAGVIVNPGVTIGEGAVVASGAVVTKHPPPPPRPAGARGGGKRDPPRPQGAP